MEVLFLKLVNMSITASWLVLAIVAVRLIFKKAPKWILCLLWGLVAVRLICPFSIESSLSLIPDPEPLSQEQVYITETVKQAHGEILDSEGNVIVERHPAINGDILNSEGNIIVEVQDGYRTYPEEEQAHGWTYVLSRIWVVGFVVMLTYTAVSYYILKKKVATAIPLKRDIKQSEYVDSPFVLGLIRPVIYLPFGMPEGDMAYVIAHEKAHIRRRDQWWKPFGFLLLSIYWFNPVLWVAYILLCRDIEAACDEKVIKDMKLDDRRAYSTALLNCSIHRRRIAACPLAFGEVGVKDRVKGVMNYKKPAFWVILIALVICIIISICFLTDPSGMHLYEIDDSRNYSDLFTNTDDITLIQEGEEYPVYDTEELLKQLDKVKVRKLTLDRSRSEDRDKTNQIHLREKLYLNFSWDYTHVWIDNLVKPTYTYRVINPDQLQTIFETLAGVNRKLITQDVTPTSATVVCFPEDAYSEVDTIWDSGYWLEHWDGNAWNEVKATGEKGLAEIDVNRILDEGEENKHYVDWTTSHGALSGGKYRLGTKFYFLESDILRTFYAEFSIPNKVHPWFDENYNSGLTYPRKTGTITIPGTETKLLYRNQFTDNLDEDQLLVQTEGGYKTVITGTEIRNAYLTDLTGDGIMEVCATVWAYYPIYNFHIAVYDYSENRVYTMESPGELQYELTCHNDTLIATVQKENLGSVLQMGTLALISDNQPDGSLLQMIPLNDSFRELTETIICIDLFTRKSVCCSSSEEIETMVSLLRDLQSKVEPVTMAELEPILADDFNWNSILLNYELGRKQLRFSADFQYIWEEGIEGGYRITESEALRNYVEKVTDGVRNKKTYGEPFATMDTPWDWCAEVSADAISTANMDVNLYTIGSKSGSTGGAISSTTLEELISILNQIPKTAFQYERVSSQTDYHNFCSAVGQTGVCVSLKDTVNQMLVAIRTNGSRIELLTTNDLEKIQDEYGYEFFDSVKMWTIESTELVELLQTYFEDPPVITYFVGSEYDWQPSVKFTAGDFKLTLWLIEGWEYEEYSDRNSSGIRCRPADVEEGWIYFSYWPNGYEPVEEDRYFFDGYYNDRLHRVSYPGSVSNETGIDTRHAIWSYQYDDLVDGDYAVINDGVDSWFLEYEDQISDIITISIAIEE